MFVSILLVPFFGFFVKSHQVQKHKKLTLFRSAGTTRNPVSDREIIGAISGFVASSFVKTDEPLVPTLRNIFDLRTPEALKAYETKIAGLKLSTNPSIKFHNSENILEKCGKIGELRKDKNEHYLVGGVDEYESMKAKGSEMLFDTHLGARGRIREKFVIYKAVPKTSSEFEGYFADNKIPVAAALPLFLVELTGDEQERYYILNNNSAGEFFVLKKYF
jgi:hypothetical protein